MRIRFLKHYRLCAPGLVTDMDGPIAELLISRHIAEPVVRAEYQRDGGVEAATVQPGEAAVRRSPRKRQARKKG